MNKWSLYFWWLTKVIFHHSWWKTATFQWLNFSEQRSGRIWRRKSGMHNMEEHLKWQMKLFLAARPNKGTPYSFLVITSTGQCHEAMIFKTLSYFLTLFKIIQTLSVHDYWSLPNKVFWIRNLAWRAVMCNKYWYWTAESLVMAKIFSLTALYITSIFNHYSKLISLEAGMFLQANLLIKTFWIIVLAIVCAKAWAISPCFQQRSH